MPSNNFIARMLISAYRDITCETPIDDPADIQLQVNPQEISLKFAIEYGEGGGSDSGSGSGGLGNNTDSAAGSSFKPRVFTGYSCPGLHIETVVDATGLLPDPYENMYHSLDDGSPQPTVEYYIERLKKVVYAYQAESHGPPFLSISWGSVLPSHSNDSAHPEGVYKCQLREMEIKYTLFSKDGFPVRAEISMDFDGVEDPEKAVSGYSPDLTHFVQVKYGDNLPKLCKDIYGSPEFFLQIARINNLPSIYAIEPGMQLLFPPLEKASR